MVILLNIKGVKNVMSTSEVKNIWGVSLKWNLTELCACVKHAEITLNNRGSILYVQLVKYYTI